MEALELIPTYVVTAREPTGAIFLNVMDDDRRSTTEMSYLAALNASCHTLGALRIGITPMNAGRLTACAAFKEEVAAIRRDMCAANLVPMCSFERSVKL